MNPIISYFKDYFKVKTENIEKIFIDYHDGDVTPVANVLYTKGKELKNNKIEIDPVKFVQFFSFLTMLSLSNGIEYDSMFLDHRKVKSLNFILPDGLIHLEMEDEIINENRIEIICNSMRNLFKVS